MAFAEENKEFAMELAQSRTQEFVNGLELGTLMVSHATIQDTTGSFVSDLLTYRAFTRNVIAQEAIIGPLINGDNDLKGASAVLAGVREGIESAINRKANK